MRALPWLLASVGLVACSDSDGQSTTTGGGGTGAGAGSSSSSSGSSVSTGTGTGGDAEWSLIEWRLGACEYEVAAKPEHAFPPLEWEPCPGSPEGCERIVRNWPSGTAAGLSNPAVRAADGGHELGIVVVYPELEQRLVYLNPQGQAVAAYRMAPSFGCLLLQPGLAASGHWVGMQHVDGPVPARYAFHDSASGQDAIVPLTVSSQYQRGADELFVVQLGFGTGLELYDRSTSSVHSTPPGVGADIPRLLDDAALFVAYPDFEKPEAWIWTRASGSFTELIDRNPDHVVDVNSDGQTLVWIQTPLKSGNSWPAGSLYTAPHATTAAAVSGTERRSMPQVVPGASSAMGGGYYAVWGSSTAFYVVRLSDAQLWTVNIPMDEWQALLNHVSFIDDTFVFYKTDTHVYRQRLDALGPGSPAN